MSLNRQYTNQEERVSFLEDEVRGPAPSFKIIINQVLPEEEVIDIGYNGLNYTVEGDTFTIGETANEFNDNKRLEITRNGRVIYQEDHIKWLSSTTFQFFTELEVGEEIRMQQAPIKKSQAGGTLTALTLQLEEIAATGIRNWVESTLYKPGYKVTYDDGIEKKIFECVVIHTSSSNFSSDLANWATLATTGTNPTVNGVDAEFLNSQEGNYYLDRTNHTGNISSSNISDKALAGGVASLDGQLKVPQAQLRGLSAATVLDLVPDYLSNKLVAGTNVNIIPKESSGYHYLEISAGDSSSGSSDYDTTIVNEAQLTSLLQPTGDTNQFDIVNTSKKIFIEKAGGSILRSTPPTWWGGTQPDWETYLDDRSVPDNAYDLKQMAINLSSTGLYINTNLVELIDYEPGTVLFTDNYPIMFYHTSVEITINNEVIQGDGYNLLNPPVSINYEANIFGLVMPAQDVAIHLSDTSNLHLNDSKYLGIGSGRIIRNISTGVNSSTRDIEINYCGHLTKNSPFIQNTQNLYKVNVQYPLFTDSNAIVFSSCIKLLQCTINQITNGYAFRYSSVIELPVVTFTTTTGIGIQECDDIRRAVVSNGTSAFQQSDNIYNSRAISSQLGFSSCNNIINSHTTNTQSGFASCRYISNASAVNCSSIAFSNCEDLTNCSGDTNLGMINAEFGVAFNRGYFNCINLSNCTATKTLIGFYDCKNITSSRAIDIGNPIGGNTVPDSIDIIGFFNCTRISGSEVDNLGQTNTAHLLGGGLGILTGLSGSSFISATTSTNVKGGAFWTHLNDIATPVNTKVDPDSTDI